jgi:ketosteroid isomerase-like protein
VSEQDNVQTIVKIYEAFGRGDVPYILGQMTDDVRWVVHLDPVVPWAGDFSTRARVGGFFSALNEHAETMLFEPKELIAQGDTVVSTGEYAFRARGSGKSSRGPWVFIWKLRDGKVYSYEQFHDPSAAAVFR